MRRSSILLAFLILTSCASRWDVTVRLDDGIVKHQPRIVHQGIRSALGVGAYYGLRTVGLRPGPAGAVGATLSGLVPHLYGYSRNRFTFAPCDWAADAWIAGGSSVVASLCDQKGSWCKRAVPTYAAGWALAAGCASP